MSSRHIPGPSAQAAFTQAFPVGQSLSMLQAMGTQPDVRACTGPMLCAATASQR